MLPNKLQKGQQFKTATVDKINEIIDYLKTQRLIGDNKTIKVNQLTNNVALTVLNNGQRKGGSSSEINHPFKLSIFTKQDGTKVLHITQARIIINGDEGTRVYFGYEENDIGLATELPLPQQEGIFNVDGYICFDENAPANDLNTLGWGAGCIYSDYNSTTAQFTLSCGLYHFIIGSIEVKKDEEGNFSYSIYRQLLFSSLSIDDGSVLRDFRGHWQLSTYPKDGTVVAEMIANKFVLNKGIMYSDGKNIDIAELIDNGTPAEQTLFCIEFNANGQSAQYKKIPVSEWKYYDEQTAIYLIPVCLTYPTNVSVVAISQYIEGSLIFNIKSKIVLNAEDQFPAEYLQDKIKYEIKKKEQLSEDEKKIFTKENSYIVGVTEDANEKSTAENKVKNLFDTLYWNWQGINGFKKEKEQILKNDKGDLKWDVASSNIPEVSGSLAALIEIEQMKNDDGEETPVLRYKPEYQTNLDDDFFYFIAQNHDHKITTWTWSGETKGQGVMSWDYELKQPIVQIPPEATEEFKEYVLVGAKEQKLKWMPYKDGTNISLSGSMQNVFQLVDDTSGKVLRVLSQYDGSIEQYHFLNLDEEGKLQATTLEGEGVDSLMIWDNENKNPTTYDCPDAEQDKLFILTGDKDNGVLWQNLYDFTYTVKVSEEDAADDYLYNKVGSADESIIVSIDDTEAYQLLDLTINPDFFISSDESIIITYTQDGYLDFTGAGMVQVTEDDVPDFLVYKIASSKEHLTIDVDSDELGQFLDINIDSATFISSDYSVTIEQTEDGYIDFTEAGRVQVTADDLPDYLDQKLSSSKKHLTIEHGQNGQSMTMDLNIDVAAFTSSDESVTIEQTEEGLIDFYGAGKVQVTADDQAEYLLDKIYSEDNSILVQLGETGEAQAVNIKIDPEYFFSSDESIIITATEEGIDFTGAGMVQVTESDQPGFLIDKIASSKEHLIVDLGADSIGQYVDINIDPATFISSDESVVIEATEDGYIDFTGAGMVQVNETDMPDFLSNKITSEDDTIIVEDIGNAVNLALNTDIFYSSDESISVENTDIGIDLRSECKVKISEDDTPTYLAQKFENNDLINFQNQGSTMTAELGQDAIMSGDESIDVNITNGFADIRSKGKVKCSENDIPDYLNSKVNIDPSIAGLISLEKENNQLLIKSAITGSGILVVENGTVKTFAAPSSGKYVFTCENGSFSWKQYKDCENACEQ